MSEQLLQAIAGIVGNSGLLTEAGLVAPYLEEQRDLFHGKALAVVRPGSTEEVAAVVRLCAAAGVAIVPQGGNTGLCGGAAPDDSGRQIILSLGRMNRLRSLDALNYTMTVDAGMILATAQDLAAEADCLFPLSFGAEGSAQIGGVISTNAGGSGVLRYGNARELVMGLEVVMADGRIWNGLRVLRKNNTGYDLRQLFVGAEGTLGIVTGAVLKLFPKPHEVQTAFCALSGLDAALALLARARQATGDQVSACELIPRAGLEMAAAHVAGVSDPLEAAHDWYLLLEVSTAGRDGRLAETFETLLGEAMEAGEVTDAVIAATTAQQTALWKIREGIPEAQKHEGGSIKHDVSVPTSLVPRFIREATAAVEAALPGVRPVPFGHVGDGNIHFNLSQPVGADKAAYLAEWGRMNRIVHDVVAALDGSISAEHGIGQLKKGELAHYKDGLEIELMARIKAALDPAGIFNPGKVIPDEFVP